MNFLSHYYLDAQTDSPEFVLGIATPDLVKGFSIIYNKKFRGINMDELPKKQRSFLEGVHRHFEIDAVFHNSKSFEEEVDNIEKLIIEADISSMKKKVFFLAHILYELLLDRLIMRYDDQILNTYYGLLEKVDIQTISYLFEAHNAHIKLEQLKERFNSFMTHKYLYKYSDTSGLVFGICSIYGRVLKVDISEGDKRKLIEVADIADKNLDKRWKEIMAQFQD